MKIVQISKYNSAGGGASRIAEQLVMEIRDAGHDVVHYCRGSSKGFNNIRIRLYGKWVKKLMGIMNRLGLVEIIPFELPILLLRKKIYQADVIHFHDISGTCSVFTVMFLSWFKRVVWTLHDASFLTGGCLQPINCHRFGRGCGGCPQLGKWPLDTKIDLTLWILKFKKICIKYSNIKFVVPSKWLEQLSKQVSINPLLIRNGVDKKIYNFESQQREKKRPKKKVLISAVNLSNKDKFDVNSLKFLEDYKENEISITLLGQSSNLIIDSKFEIVKMGYIEDENKIANLYRSADVLFYPSLAESCGLTILEAACCNLPVLCYSNTAISELICELNLNLLVRKEKILDNLNEPNSNRVPDIKDMFKKYLELYKMIN